MHTKGPWRFGGSLITTASQPETWIATVLYQPPTGARRASLPPDANYCAPKTGAESDANRALIALAPELADALRGLVATARTFRNVPKEEQEWTSIDDLALDNAFAILARLEP